MGKGRAAPSATIKDVSSAVETLRAIKSPGELALLQKALDASVDAHFAAMKMLHSGLYEYQVAAKMVEIHAEGRLRNRGVCSPHRRLGLQLDRAALQQARSQN